jgi:hypothetical protein
LPVSKIVKQILSFLGTFEGTIEKTDGGIIVNGHKVMVFD